MGEGKLLCFSCREKQEVVCEEYEASSSRLDILLLFLDQKCQGDGCCCERGSAKRVGRGFP